MTNNREDYEELEAHFHELIRENAKLKADLRDARQALGGVKEALLRKLEQARLVSRCEECPLWKETEE